MLNIDYLANHNATKNVAATQKIFFSLTSLLLVTIIRNNNVSLFALLFMSCLIILYAKIPWKTYVGLLVAPIGFIFAGVASIIISISMSQAPPEYALWEASLGNIQFFILPNDLTRAWTLFITALSATSCLYFLIFTTPIYEISPVLGKLKVPSIIIELIELIYRFIFLFLQTASQLFTAQQARLGYRTVRISFQSLSLLISALFQSIFFRYQVMSYAMSARNIEQFLIPSSFLPKKQWDPLLTSIALLFYIISATLWLLL